MDGSAADCQTVDQLLTNNSIGTAIVYSAGNDGDSRFHARGTVPAGPAAVLKLNFKIAANDKKGRSLSIRYAGSNLQVRVSSPVVATAGAVGWVTPGNSTVSNTANGLGGTVTVNNTPNRISIRLSPGPVLPPTNPATFRPNIDGTWTIELQDTGSTPTDFNAFCLFGSSHDWKSPFFLDHDTSDSTLGQDACGKECISVGSYKVGGRLSSFSSRGPTIETAPTVPRTKPEICAPGQDIVSAGLPKDRHGCKQCCCKCCRDYYVSMSGTSMSAPHIAGVIALMLHKNPTLTHTQIKAALVANAAPKPTNSTSAEDVGWGAGKVDVKKTVDAETQVNAPVPKVAVPQTDALGALQEQLLATERGPELASLFDKHADEVIGLINRNKRVATVWHRCRGPVWVRLALRAAHTPQMRVPLEADGLSLQESVWRFGAILKRYASAAFQQDLLRYEADFGLVADGMTLQEMIDIVGNRRSVMAA
jgi:subtilisin family serine protease